tara:strand:+ start:2009 stop:2503 length:495 start_codon:yes stop_codon:yes gene_type:complete
MRLIAVLGVLLVLASCSDMDINGNNKFAVACYDEMDRDNEVALHLVFDRNTVTKYNKPLEANQSFSTHKIKSYSYVSPLLVIFEDTSVVKFGSVIEESNLIAITGKSDAGKEMFIFTFKYTLDKQSLTLYRDTLYVTNMMLEPVDYDTKNDANAKVYYCKKSQI